jgi:hypothetical protein
MIWFTWRQFRTQAWITVGALAAVGVLLVITGRTIADAYDAANVAACGRDCSSAIDNFLHDVNTGTSDTVYDLAAVALYLVPALIGVFWGAPLLARELETGTHRLAWNQSVTRTRWLATKLAIVGGAAAAAVGLLSWAVTSWAHQIDQATGDRIKPVLAEASPGLYEARGVVPIGYALFAFILGVTFGMLIRRIVLAMAATLATYAAAVVSMQEWIREHLVSTSHVTRSLDTSSLDRLNIGPGQMTVTGSHNLPGAWILSNQTITATGEVFKRTADPQYCAPEGSAQACQRWLGTLGLRQDLTYHPASDFWPLQWAETGILLAAALLLAGFCFWWTRRRLT